MVLNSSLLHLPPEFWDPGVHDHTQFTQLFMD